MSASSQHKITVDGETIDIWVAKDGKSYRAWATFRDRHITVRSDSESGAISKWRESANHAANE